MSAPPLLRAERLAKSFAGRIGCRDVSFELHVGEILGVVGESGSGKTTLLRCLSGQLEPDAGHVAYASAPGELRDIFAMSEAERRHLARTEWGFVHQNPRDGLRMAISAGANVGERLMAVGWRNYAAIRGSAAAWLAEVEIAADRIDDLPRDFSGGMQQRLQIARNLVSEPRLGNQVAGDLVSEPRLVFMDEPTGGLDVSVQARLLDLLRRLVQRLGLACIVVTHDLGVVRMLCDRLLVMQGGCVVEEGLTDQVLDDPQHPYTQLLVSSILPV